MSRRYWITLFLILPIVVNAQQSLRFQRLNVNNGLSQNTVISIVQDHNGFMWMATQDGLNRYDGYSFKVYRHVENDPNSLSNNYVMNLVVDKTGNVWAGTTKGLNRIDGKTGRLTRIDLTPLVKDAANYRIHCMAVGEDSAVYFGMSWGLFCVRPSGKLIRVKNFDDKTSITELLVQKNKLWLGLGTKIICYDYVSNKFLDTSVLSKELITLLQVKDSCILYKRNDRLWQFNFKSHNETEVYTRYFNTGGVARKCVSIYPDRNDEWICTQNGLIWQHQQDTLLIKHFEDYEFSLSSDYVYCVFKDRSGLYWIGTSRGGLCIFNPSWQKFKIISKPLGLRVAVWGIVEKNDTLVLGTAKGIKLYRRKNRGVPISNTFLPEHVLTEIKVPALQEQIKDLLISSVCIDARANLWIGTENNGVYHYNFAEKKLKLIFKKKDSPSELVSNNVLHLDTISGTSIGVSSSYGFSTIDIHSLKIKTIYLTHLNKKIFNNYILKSWPEGDTIWFSSASGVCLFKNGSENVQQFLPDKNNIAEQYHNIVSDIKKDTKNQYWVSTLGYGLLSFDLKKGIFKRFGAANGLKNETVLGILPDDNNCLWLGTNEGIAKFDIGTGLFEDFDTHEGLDSKECTKNGFYKSPNGDLFFGTMSGLVVFNPNALRKETPLLKTTLTGMKINYTTIENSSQYILGSNFSPDAVFLDHTVRTISFEFAALHFLNPENVSYNYRLIGFNDAWVHVNSAERNAIYTNLPPNTYTFTVVPVLNGKEITSGSLSFIVTVKPPFWLTWWFILVSILSGFFCITFIVRYYSQRKLKNKLKQAEEEQKLQKEKERISRELHDNVGSQLTYIIKSLDNLSYKSGNKDEPMVQHLDALGDFSRETLSQLRESIWAINSKSIAISELVTKVHEYVNKINNSFEKTQISVEVGYETNTLLKPTIAINSFRILQEAIINSLKYSEASLITICIRQQKETVLEFTITDNGKGFELNNLKRKGYGLENMRARAAELGTTLTLDSGPGKGTRIHFTTGA